MFFFALLFTALICPECGELAVRRPPRSLVNYAAHNLETPEYSHEDGEPLCPVMGPNGYRPAQPVLLRPKPRRRSFLGRRAG